MQMCVNEEYKQAEQQVAKPMVVNKRGSNYVNQKGEILSITKKIICKECVKSANQANKNKSALKLLQIVKFIQNKSENQNSVLWVPCLGCSRIWDRNNCNANEEYIFSCEYGHPYCYCCALEGPTS